MKKILILLSALLIVATNAQSCAQDYDCGSLPYGQCQGGVNECSTTIAGLGLDEEDGVIYYMQVCRTNEVLSNLTLKQVSTEGSVPLDVQTRIQIPAQGNPVYLSGVFNNFVYYALGLRQPGNALVALDLETLQQTDTINTGGFFQNYLAFDSASHITFLCNYKINNSVGNVSIDRINGILGQDETEPPQTLYVLEGYRSCGALKKPSDSDYIYFSDRYFDGTKTISTIYRLLADCTDDCNPDKLTTIQELITDFDVVNDSIFFVGTNTGLWAEDLATGINTQITSSQISGVRAYNDKVFWNDGFGIKSAPIEELVDIQQVNFPSNGTCTCLPGFFGDDCLQCDGQVQWQSGKPRCVAIVDGLPVTCTASYQCGNEPFGICLGTCQCASGFTGLPDCTTCAPPKNVTWTSFGPVCA